MATKVDVTQEAKAAIEKAMQYPIGQPEPELIGKVPERANKTNGPLPRENVQRGLAHFDQLEADNERLKRELNEARELHRLLEIELQEIKNVRGTIEERIKTCLADRDKAVHQAGELFGVLNSIASICVRYHHAQQDPE